MKNHNIHNKLVALLLFLLTFTLSIYGESTNTNKLPQKPQIKNIKFEFEYDWKYDMIWPNGTLSFDVYSEGANQFILDATPCFLHSYNKLVPFICEFVYKGQNFAHITYDAEWGEYLIIAAANQYGYVDSDLLFTTDYITDKDVLNRINELKELADVDKPISIDKPNFRISNGQIIVDGGFNKAFVYNICGQLITSQTDADTIDMQDFPKGMYIICIEDKNNSVHKSKILLP